MTFKRTGDDGCFGTCWKLVEIPLNFLRDYTIPMADISEWDRTRAAMLPLTLPWAAFFLNGMFTINDDSVDSDPVDREAEILQRQFYIEFSLYSMVPMLFFVVYIRMCTKISQPPDRLLFIYAILGFVMSINWISFTCNIVVDLLSVLGVMLSLPKTLLGLTLLAWGNCLGDMNANVAMTKKGFGEMAVTGCMAGPVFNVLMGLGLSTIGSLINDLDASIPFQLRTEDGELNKNAVLAVSLIVAEMLSLLCIYINA